MATEAGAVNDDRTSHVTWHVMRLWADNEVAAGTVLGLNSPGWALFPLLLVFNFVVVVVVEKVAGLAKIPDMACISTCGKGNDLALTWV